MILMFYDPKIIEIYDIIILTKKILNLEQTRGNILKESQDKKFRKRLINLKLIKNLKIKQITPENNHFL